MARGVEPGPPRDPLKARLLRLYQALLDTVGQSRQPRRTAFAVAVGAVLTPRGGGPQAARVIGALDRAGLLTPARLAGLDAASVVRLLRPSRIGRREARAVLAFASWLVARNGGQFEPLRTTPLAVLRRDLLEVPGLGPEIVDTVLLHAAGRPVFVAGAAARRVLRRHRLFPGDASYEEARAFLEAHLPSDPALFGEYQALLGAIATSHCRTRPHCEGCPLRFDLARRRPAL